MAEVTLHPDPNGAFPPGTQVGIFLVPVNAVAGWVPAAGTVPLSEPTVANDGSLKVTGIEEGRVYVATAVVGGVGRTLRFGSTGGGSGVAILGTNGAVGGPGGSPLGSSTAALRDGLAWNGTGWEPSTVLTTPRPTLTRATSTLPTPANSTLEPGHTWALSEGAAGSTLNFTGEGGLAGQCVKLVSKGEAKISAIKLKRETAMNLAGKMLQFHFLLSAGTVPNLKELAIRLGSGASEFASGMKGVVWANAQSGVEARMIEELGQAAKEGEWWTVTIVPAALKGREGTPSWEAIQDIEIRLGDNGLGQVTLLFGGCEIVAQDSRFSTGVVSITTDDVYASQTKMAATMAKFGMKGSTFITVDKINAVEHQTTAELLHMINVNGWDLGVHCQLSADNVTSPSIGMTGLTAEQQTSDWASAQRWINEQGLPTPNHLAIPSGKFNTATLGVIQQLFSSSRLTGAAQGFETVPPADPHRLRCPGVTNASVIGPVGTAGSIKWMIKEAKEHGGWLILLFHDMAAEAKEPNTITETAFNEVIQAIHEEGVPVRKVSEVLGV